MNMKCNVAILAGGVGSRLSRLIGPMPKSMVQVNGKPILQHQIDLCRRYGFTKIALLVHYRHDLISEYFGDGSKFGVSIVYSIDDRLRGTAGSLNDALPLLDDRFLVLYGDTYADINLKKFWRSHVNSNVTASLFLHPNDHPHDSDLIEIDADNHITKIFPYPHPKSLELSNLVNGALYIIERNDIMYMVSQKKKEDIAKDLFPRLLDHGYLLFGYVSPEYIKDMGTPERLHRVEKDILYGLPERLSDRNLRSAVFLDRDGTLINEVNHLHSLDQLVLLPDVTQSIHRLNTNGKLAIVVTNQPVLARGELTFEQLRQIHARLETRLGEGGSFLNGIYVCPHHPHSGFQNEVSELKIHCICRKPETGLIDQACRELRISRSKSWMIGDTTTDIEVGRRAGLKTILLLTGYAGSDNKYVIKPNYIFKNLTEAIDWILEGHPSILMQLAPIAVEVINGKKLVLIGGMPQSRKRHVAQALNELLMSFGKVTHVISIDSWFMPDYQKKEKIIDGLDDKINNNLSIFDNIIQSNLRSEFEELIYDWITGNNIIGVVKHSIGPDDILILEGNLSILIERLITNCKLLKIYVETVIEKGEKPLRNNCQKRKADVSKKLRMREMAEEYQDEGVLQTRILADYII